MAFIHRPLSIIVIKLVINFTLYNISHKFSQNDNFFIMIFYLIVLCFQQLFFLQLWGIPVSLSWCDV